jgi:hypothetical protein
MVSETNTMLFQIEIPIELGGEIHTPLQFYGAASAALSAYPNYPSVAYLTDPGPIDDLVEYLYPGDPALVLEA